MSVYSKHEITKALEFNELLKSKSKLAPHLEAQTAQAFSHVSMLDLETYDLSPKSSIYEASVVHGIGDPTIKHHFVRPEGDIPSSFSQKLISERASGSSPDILHAIKSAPLGQKGSARELLAELSGRDVWVQNLPFERGFLNERTQFKDSFDTWARQSKLESFSPDGGLYPTTPKYKEAIEHARAGQSNLNSVDEYLGRWASVFGEIETVLDAPRPEGVTRVFEQMDLTKSVFALAQQNDKMAKTGELFAGTNISALAKAAFGVEELHTAAGDNILQGHLAKFLYGTGKAIKQGEELTDQQKGFFQRIAEIQQETKQNNAVKNIIETFKSQQEYLITGENTRENLKTLSRARTDFESTTVHKPLLVRGEDGQYSSSVHSYQGRKNWSRSAYSTDIEDVIGAWKVRDGRAHGLSADYDKALEEANRLYIKPYQQKYKELGGDISAALAAMKGTSDEAVEALSAKTSAAMGGAAPAAEVPSFLRKNWKIGAGAVAALMLGSALFSGKDDEYNTIEGMRHGGFAGDSRKSNTDFGSGWNALRGLTRAGETFEEMLRTSDFRKALQRSIPREIIGEGAYGKAEMRLAMFRGKPFPFVRKTGDIGKDEAALMERVSGSVSPNVYSSSPSHIDMEYFSGQAVKQMDRKQAQGINWDSVKSAIKEVHKEGIYHNDLNTGNIVRTNEGHIGIIDFGQAVDTRPDPTGRYSFIDLTGSKMKLSTSSANRAMTADYERASSGLSYKGVSTGNDIEFADTRDMLHQVHNPNIQGIGHPGGVSDTVSRRHALTDFGSGWRGLIRIAKEEVGAVLGGTGNEIGGAVFQETGSAILQKVKERGADRFAKALQESIRSGQEFPVVINVDAIKATKAQHKELMGEIVGTLSDQKQRERIFAENKATQSDREEAMAALPIYRSAFEALGHSDTTFIKGAIKHERFHQKVKNSKALENKVKNTKVPKEFEEVYEEVGYVSGEGMMKEEYIAHEIQYSHYPESLASSPFYPVFKKLEDEGRLGITPARRRRIKAMAKAGRPSTNTALNPFDPVQKKILPKRNRPINEIEALGHPDPAHSDTAARRRALTDFGSGWRGLPKAFSSLFERFRQNTRFIGQTRAANRIGTQIDNATNWMHIIDGDMSMAGYVFNKPKSVLSRNLDTYLNMGREASKYDTILKKVTDNVSRGRSRIGILDGKTDTALDKLGGQRGFYHSTDSKGISSILATQRVLPGSTNVFHKTGEVGVYLHKAGEGSSLETIRNGLHAAARTDERAILFIPEQEASNFKFRSTSNGNVTTDNQALSFSDFEIIKNNPGKHTKVKVPADKTNSGSWHDLVSQWTDLRDSVKRGDVQAIERADTSRLRHFDANAEWKLNFKYGTTESANSDGLTTLILKGIKEAPYDSRHIGRPTKLVNEESGYSMAFSRSEELGLASPDNKDTVASVFKMSEDIAALGGKLHVKGGIARERLVSSIRPELARESKDIDLLVTGNVKTSDIYGVMEKHQTFLDVQVQPDLDTFFRGTDMTANQAVIEVGSGKLLHTRAAADDITAGKIRYLDMSDAGRAHQRIAKFQGYYPGIEISPGKISGQDGAYDIIEAQANRLSTNMGLNPFDGFPENGVAGATRSKTTDFGSPWQGLNTRFPGDQHLARLEVKDYQVEDADTVNIMLSGGNKLTLRLAGIDAPETEHGDSYASGKVFQDQPWGREATSQLETLLGRQGGLTAVLNPEGGSTYGRAPALLFGDDGTNINLELVRQGAAASLPFGKASERLASASEFNRAQDEAYESSAGMWSDPGWRAAANIQGRTKQKITHNTFTNLEKLFRNFRASSIVHRLRNPDADFSQMAAAGGRDDFNIAEGLRHGWAQTGRGDNTDFGSGWQGLKTVINKVSNKTKKNLMQGSSLGRSWSKRMFNSRHWTKHHEGV